MSAASDNGVSQRLQKHYDAFVTSMEQHISSGVKHLCQMQREQFKRLEAINRDALDEKQQERYTNLQDLFVSLQEDDECKLFYRRGELTYFENILVKPTPEAGSKYATDSLQ